MLVTVQADAVAEPVGKEFVAGPVTGGRHYGASSVIDCAGEASSAGRIQGGVLCLAQRVEDFDEFIGRLLAKNDSARYVRLVSFYFSSAIDQDNVAGL